MRSHPTWCGELLRTFLIYVVVLTVAIAARWFGSGLSGAVTGLPGGKLLAIDSTLAAGSLAIRAPRASVPISLVDIDEELYTLWDRPCITPREQLARLIERVAEQRPRVIIVDVALGCDHVCCAAGGMDQLDAFLRDYRGPAPLVLVRELWLQRRKDGTVEVRGREDGIANSIATNPLVSRGHTFYLADSDGTTRHWQPWWEACVDDRTEVVPALTMITLHLASRESETHTPVAIAASRTGHCELGGQASPKQLVVLGPRITGTARRSADPNEMRRMPAKLLLEPKSRLDPRGYYGLEDRVAIIGASHSGSADRWRTANGYIPGAELLANTIRFASVQVSQQGSMLRSSSQIAFILLLLVLLAFFFRPLVALFLASVTVLSVAVLAVNWLEWFDIFESLETAIWCFAGIQACLGLLSLWKDLRRYQGVGKWRSLLSSKLQSADR